MNVQYHASFLAVGEGDTAMSFLLLIPCFALNIFMSKQSQGIIYNYITISLPGLVLGTSDKVARFLWTVPCNTSIMYEHGVECSATTILETAESVTHTVSVFKCLWSAVLLSFTLEASQRSSGSARLSRDGKTCTVVLSWHPIRSLAELNHLPKGLSYRP